MNLAPRVDQSVLCSVVTDDTLCPAVLCTQDGEGRCLTARTNQTGAFLDADPCSQTWLQSFVVKVTINVNLSDF